MVVLSEQEIRDIFILKSEQQQQKSVDFSLFVYQYGLAINYTVLS